MVSLLLILLASCQSGARLSSGTGRCIWVDRWDWRSQADIERIVAQCEGAGFTTILFQVRGNGTVSYPSSIEPWSERFGFQDPGFDPLATAIRAAHAQGLQLHAWVNVVPGWVGEEDPTAERQLWRSRRQWFLQDRESRWQRPAPGKYLCLNPCLPEVRSYLTDLCREVATRYDVDGVHLDYVRFPDPEPQAAGGLGTDPVSVAMFTGATGRRSSDSEALRRWQVECVSRLVADISAAVRAARDRTEVTAAVFADPEIALRKVQQDWPLWCRRGYVDAVFPMNYAADDRRFVAQAQKAVRAADGVDVIMGIGLYKLESAEQGRSQLDAAMASGASGVGVFSYRALFGASAEVPVARQQELRSGIGAWLEASVAR